jgi:hypothetical protein
MSPPSVDYSPRLKTKTRDLSKTGLQQNMKDIHFVDTTLRDCQLSLYFARVYTARK